MILPQTYAATLLLMILSMLCLAVWVSTFKLAGNWRFELYYFDFTFGLVIAAAIYAFTVGNLGYDGFNFLDDVQHAGKRQWLFCFLAGMIFNLANLLLVAAVSLAGAVVAFPMTMGIALILGALVGVANMQAAGVMMVLLGSGFLLASVMVNAMGYRLRSVQRHEALARSGKAKSTRRPTSFKEIILCVSSGLLMGSFPLLLDKARQGEVGLGPYGLGAMFTFGIFLSTFAFDVFFMSLPVEGDPLEFPSYFASQWKQHILGLLGGIIWCTGMLAAMVATAAPDTAQVSLGVRSFLSQAAPLLTAALGIFAWREIKDADVRVKSFMLLMIVLYTCGLLLLSVAPLYTRPV